MNDSDNENLFDDEAVELLSLGSIGLEDLLQSQAELIPTNASVPILDIGQHHQDWIHFLDTLAPGSRKAYENQIRLFAEWLALQTEHRSDEENVKVYFNEQHDLNILPGAKSFAPTRYRSMASIFMSFWSYSGKIFC